MAFWYVYQSQMLHVWNIYLHLVIFGVNVGRYSSTMEHMGEGKHKSSRFVTEPVGGFTAHGWRSDSVYTLFEYLGVQLGYMFYNKPPYVAGWWFEHLWKMMEFVSWDDDIPNGMESHKIPWFQTIKQILYMAI